MKKRIGILGGTFDPFHFGHLNLAIAFLESHPLDQVLFCPTQVSPFKKDHPPLASAQHRLEMLSLGIQKINAFSILDWEIHIGGPTYTIDTIKRLKTELNEDLFLLLGEDQLSDLHRWKNVETLFSLCLPLIASRETSAPLSFDLIPLSIQPFLSRGRRKIPMMDISSTIIRHRLNQKKICGHLVPHLILDYIEQHHLYS